MAHRQLTFVHRQFMARMLAQGRSRAYIAEVLGVHRSTIGRELQRNCIGQMPYCPKTAQYLADLRTRGHGHKRNSDHFEATHRIRYRQLDFLRGRLSRKRQPLWRPEKREAWERFCLRWKKQVRHLIKHGHRYRKTELFRFRRRMALPREKRFWPFYQPTMLRLKWKKQRLRWAANRYRFRQPEKGSFPQPFALTVPLPSAPKQKQPEQAVSFFRSEPLFFPAFSSKTGSLLPLLFRKPNKAAFTSKTKGSGKQMAWFSTGYSPFFFHFLRLRSAIGQKFLACF